MLLLNMYAMCSKNHRKIGLFRYQLLTEAGLNYNPIFLSQPTYINEVSISSIRIQTKKQTNKQTNKHTSM